MEKVEGIGGFFFKATDPKMLATWYADHLGVVPPPLSYDADVWTQQAGPTVFAPFGADAAEGPYLDESGWGINFRVRDLDAMVRQQRASGVTVEVDDEQVSQWQVRPGSRSRRQCCPTLGTGVDRTASERNLG